MFCYNCRFYRRADYEGPMDAPEVFPQDKDILAEGECRRYPPRHGGIVINRDNSQRAIFGDWPLVEDEYWCGEFERRKKIAAKGKL